MADLILPRRKFLTGMAALVAAPAIVRAASLMPVKKLPMTAAEWTAALLKAAEGEMTVTVFGRDALVRTFSYTEGMKEVGREMVSYGEAMFRTQMSREEFQTTYLEGLTRV